MLFGGAIPILPGKVDRARRLAGELEPHRAEYEALNKKFKLSGHSVWISHGRDGRQLLVTMYDIPALEDLKRMRSRVWDLESPYDRWWLGWVRDVLGIDLLEGDSYAQPPEPILAWEATSGG